MYSTCVLTAVLRISVNIPLHLAGGNEVPKHHSASTLNLSYYAWFSFSTVFYAMFCMASRNEYSFRRIKSQINTIVLLGYSTKINPLKPELNPICYLLALLAHHFLHISRIRVKSLTFRRLMSYIYIWSTHS